MVLHLISGVSQRRPKTRSESLDMGTMSLFCVDPILHDVGGVGGQDIGVVTMGKPMFSISFLSVIGGPGE
jgi:hypothetical protein